MQENTAVLFKKLFSALILYRHNIQILHWKCTGEDFDAVHKRMDDYTFTFNTMVDRIGELMLSLGINPQCLCSVMKNLEEPTDEKFVCLDGDDDYISEKVNIHIAYMFKGLINIYEDIRKDEELPSDVVSVLDEHTQWLRLERDYKNTTRID